MPTAQSIESGPDVVAQAWNLPIKRSDIKLLLPQEWLNDVLIEFYMRILNERCSKLGLSHWCFAPAFWIFLTNNNLGYSYKRVARWTTSSHVDIFSRELVIVPIHKEDPPHWALAAIEIQKRRIVLYDSLNSNEDEFKLGCLKNLRQYLDDEHNDKKGSRFDDSTWKTIISQDNPKQKNGDDCGVFCCMTACFLCFGLRL